MTELFEGKQGLITGVFNKQSIAWAIADRVMQGGGECGFSYMPDRPDDTRQKNYKRIAQLVEGNPLAKFVQPMDVTDDAQIAAFMDRAREELNGVDFLLHSIAFAPPEDLRGETIDTSREGFKLAIEISAYSLIALSKFARPLLNDGASILTLTYFGGEKAVPGYNVMGVCKATLDAAVRYLAFELGPDNVRVNAISAGPLQTVSGRGAGVDDMLRLYEAMSPLGRNITHQEAGNCGAFLLSDMSTGVTGEILHLDGGYNIMGTPGRLLDRVNLRDSS